MSEARHRPCSSRPTRLRATRRARASDGGRRWRARARVLVFEPSRRALEVHNVDASNRRPHRVEQLLDEAVAADGVPAFDAIERRQLGAPPERPRSVSIALCTAAHSFRICAAPLRRPAPRAARRGAIGGAGLGGDAAQPHRARRNASSFRREGGRGGDGGGVARGGGSGAFCGGGSGAFCGGGSGSDGIGGGIGSAGGDGGGGEGAATRRAYRGGGRSSPTSSQ